MIKVAIPIFLDRISPRLDCARRLLILEIEKNRLVDKRELDISHWPPDEKIIQLSRMGIRQLICGGLRLEDRDGLNRFGIQVASALYGEVESVIKEYLNGNLQVPCCRAQERRPGRKMCHRKGLPK
jgi:predicted Fe-Mo cluster-binding NifX family protein